MILIYADDTVFSLSFPDSTHRGFEQRHTHRHADAGGANVCSTPLDRHTREILKWGCQTPHAIRRTRSLRSTSRHKKSIRRYKANIYPTLQRQVLPVFTNLPLTTYFQHSMADPFGVALAHPANPRCQSDWHCSVPQTGFAGWKFWVAGFLGIHTEQQTMAGQLGGRTETAVPTGRHKFCRVIHSCS